MQRRRSIRNLAAAALAAATLVACATGPSDEEVSAKATAVLKSSFKEQGQAKLDRLDQDELQKLCSEYASKPMPKEVSARLEAEQQLKDVTALLMDPQSPVNQ
jgi:sulfur-oxidizing protein SoxX